MRILVIGGGFYGVMVARHLASRRKGASVVLAEREPKLMTRASYNNQARIHNGYHYPRSLTTAFRSRINFPRFLAEFPFVVKRDFTKLYAIARGHSRVTARQFERFCATIGARLEPAPEAVRSLFDTRLIEQVYLADEWVFDATALRNWSHEALSAAGVDLRLGICVQSIAARSDGRMVASIASTDSNETLIVDQVFNCTYAGLSEIHTPGPALRAPLKYELTEMALFEPPPSLAAYGVTVMDGPFFSFLPFPPRGLHTLSHVRFTPHAQWTDTSNWGLKASLDDLPKVSRANRMLRDAQRYLPAMAEAHYRDSLFEIKTVLQKSENDDGRPILFERHADLPCYISILGGKIDNIYDILEKLDADPALGA